MLVGSWTKTKSSAQLIGTMAWQEVGLRMRYYNPADPAPEPICKAFLPPIQEG